jgi:hypothetical protein
VSGPIVTVFAGHGRGAAGRTGEGRLQLDGLSVGDALGGSGTGYFVPDITNAQEVSVNSSGGMGEAEVGGPTMNVVPRQGGNVFKGTFFANGANDALGSTNINPALSAVGVRPGNTVLKIWDIDGVVGGPIKQDRLWVFGGGRYQGRRNLVSGMFANVNADDPTKWTYVADPSQPAQDDGTWSSKHLRLTWQATPRNKFSFFWDRQSSCTSCLSGGQPSSRPKQRPRRTAFRSIFNRSPGSRQGRTGSCSRRVSATTSCRGEAGLPSRIRPRISCGSLNSALLAARPTEASRSDLSIAEFGEQLQRRLALECGGVLRRRRP